MSALLTLSEIESCLRKCARAVELEWGIAEEAGKAARWLAALQLPGPECMLAHLLGLRDMEYQKFAPLVDTSPWRARGELLCPIMAGATMADRSARLLTGETFHLGETAYPLLLVATLGQAARFHQTAFTTRWDDLEISCFGHALAISGDETAMFESRTDAVACWHDPQVAPVREASTLAYAIDAETLRSIDALAFATYAPASEASRAGAGAGLTDND